MTELEHILQETVVKLEATLSATQNEHAQALTSLQEDVATLQKALVVLNTDQEALSAHLQHLSSIYESLQPLLSRLNVALGGR